MRVRKNIALIPRKHLQRKLHLEEVEVEGWGFIALCHFALEIEPSPDIVKAAARAVGKAEGSTSSLPPDSSSQPEPLDAPEGRWAESHHLVPGEPAFCACSATARRATAEEPASAPSACSGRATGGSRATNSDPMPTIGNAGSACDSMEVDHSRLNGPLARTSLPTSTGVAMPTSSQACSGDTPVVMAVATGTPPTGLAAMAVPSLSADAATLGSAPPLVKVSAHAQLVRVGPAITDGSAVPACRWDGNFTFGAPHSSCAEAAARWTDASRHEPVAQWMDLSGREHAGHFVDARRGPLPLRWADTPGGSCVPLTSRWPDAPGVPLREGWGELPRWTEGPHVDPLAGWSETVGLRSGGLLGASSATPLFIPLACASDRLWPPRPPHSPRSRGSGGAFAPVNRADSPSRCPPPISHSQPPASPNSPSMRAAAALLSVGGGAPSAANEDNGDRPEKPDDERRRASKSALMRLLSGGSRLSAFSSGNAASAGKPAPLVPAPAAGPERSQKRPPPPPPPPDRTAALLAQAEPSARANGTSGGASGDRWQPTLQDVALLEQVFEIEPLPGRATREQLATHFGVTPRQVQVWFQNKRQRVRVKALKQSLTSQNPDDVLELGASHEAASLSPRSRAAAFLDGNRIPSVRGAVATPAGASCSFRHPRNRSQLRSIRLRSGGRANISLRTAVLPAEEGDCAPSSTMVPAPAVASARVAKSRVSASLDEEETDASSSDESDFLSSSAEAPAPPPPRLETAAQILSRLAPARFERGRLIRRPSHDGPAVPDLSREAPDTAVRPLSVHSVLARRRPAPTAAGSLPATAKHSRSQGRATVEQSFASPNANVLAQLAAKNICEKDPLCSRGFRHGGKGGPCSRKRPMMPQALPHPPPHSAEEQAAEACGPQEYEEAYARHMFDAWSALTRAVENREGWLPKAHLLSRCLESRHVKEETAKRIRQLHERCTAEPDNGRLSASLRRILIATGRTVLAKAPNDWESGSAASVDDIDAPLLDLPPPRPRKPPRPVRPVGQCQKDPLCTRGFKHGGKGGRCSYTLHKREVPHVTDGVKLPTGEDEPKALEGGDGDVQNHDSNETSHLAVLELSGEQRQRQPPQALGSEEGGSKHGGRVELDDSDAADSDGGSSGANTSDGDRSDEDSSDDEGTGSESSEAGGSHGSGGSDGDNAEDGSAAESDDSESDDGESDDGASDEGSGSDDDCSDSTEGGESEESELASWARDDSSQAEMDADVGREDHRPFPEMVRG